MPDVDVPVPKGYREAVVHTKSNKTGPRNKQTTTSTKQRKSTKQVSEVDDQGSLKTGKWQVDMGGASGDQQVEDKMQKTVQTISDSVPKAPTCQQCYEVEVVPAKSASNTVTAVAEPTIVRTVSGEDQQNTANVARIAPNK
jgi:hypothetical protein